MQRHRLPLQRRIAHGFILLSGWSVFTAGWLYVIVTPHAREGAITLALTLVGASILFPLLTLLWVRRNGHIHRLKGPRRTAPAVAMQRTLDWEGRRLVADIDMLQSANSIEVSLAHDTKILAALSSRVTV